MLKITPYLGVLVLIVSIGGLWYPALGYFMLLIFAAIFLISPFRGRWFCGNLCPRGSLVDFWISKISKKKKIPATLRSLWVRLPIFFLLMGFMGYRIAGIIGSLNTFEKIGMVFVTMCLGDNCNRSPSGQLPEPESLVFLLSYGNSSTPAWRKEVPAETSQRKNALTARNAKKSVLCSLKFARAKQNLTVSNAGVVWLYVLKMLFSFNFYAISGI